MRPAARLAVTVLVLTAIGCTTTAAPGSSSPAAARPTIAPTTSARPTARTRATATATPVPAVEPATTTMTDWGEIWDRLPPGFPAVPGARPVPPSEGPASGAFWVPDPPGTVAKGYQVALRAEGYHTDAPVDPAEDGSLTIDAVGAEPGCQVQITVAPRGGRTLVTIMYGAACPFR